MARFRVISDNDYAGDPDGLVQVVHQALCTDAELVGVISSHLPANDPFNPDSDSAARGAEAARTALALAGRDSIPVVAGTEYAMVDRATPQRSPGIDMIVHEAMRDDSRPLFVVAGAGLTEIASALLVEPRIEERMTVVWIGGPEHAGLATPPPPPGLMGAEYNEMIDVSAAKVVFESRVRLWQVPRDAYRQVILSMPELREGLREGGALGEHLLARIEDIRELAGNAGMDLGDTFILGDSPLVLLTGLLSSFRADPASCSSLEMVAPRIGDDGAYLPGVGERTIRVFRTIDTRLLWGDLVARLRAVGRASSA